MPRPVDADFLHWAGETFEAVDDDDRVHFEMRAEATRHRDDVDGVPEVGVMVTFPGGTPLPARDGLDTDGSPGTNELVHVAVQARRDAEALFGWYDRAAAVARMIGLHRPHGRSYPDDWWDKVAAAFFGFFKSEVHGPVQRFVDESGVPLPTANRWLATCRERGLLTDDGALAGSALEFVKSYDDQEGNDR